MRSGSGCGSQGSVVWPLSFAGEAAGFYVQVRPQLRKERSPSLLAPQANVHEIDRDCDWQTPMAWSGHARNVQPRHFNSGALFAAGCVRVEAGKCD